MKSEKSVAQKIAEASGIEIEMQVPRGENSARPWLVTQPENKWPWSGHWFDPQTKASDAILAAERFGLFDNSEHDGIRLSSDEHGWYVWRVFPDRHTEPLGRGTFCEAICQAILRLAGERDGTGGGD